VQQQLDDQRVLLESLSDEFDASTLLDVDDALSFRRPGIGTDVTRKLRKGHWSIQRELDLHGLRSDAARELLGAFIRDAHKQGIRCVRVVHGKGLGSPGKDARAQGQGAQLADPEERGAGLCAGPRGRGRRGGGGGAAGAGLTAAGVRSKLRARRQSSP
jgi:hypothetical protein